MSKNWWGAVWAEKMERLAEPRRFAEGARWAAGNRVQHMHFDGRMITGTVNGTGEPPYKVQIRFDPFSSEQWEQLFANVRDKRALASSLAAGDLPLETQTAFSKAKLRFMPERSVDLHLECACPDWLKPCKHLVAVWMRFARDFDRDPFLLFQLRGMKRDELFDLMQSRPVTVPEPEPEAGDEYGEEMFPVMAEPLPADPAVFWAEPAIPPAAAGSVERRLLDDDIFENLGPAPFCNWGTIETQFHQVYDAVYELGEIVLRK